MAKEPLFLDLDEVLALHADQVARYGGSGGVRDMPLLESALGMARAAFGGVYLHPTLPEMAAAYLYHLVRNHPFVDGNKRTGLAVALAFLGLNGMWLEVEPERLVVEMIAVADGTRSKAAVAELIREHLMPFR